MVAIFCSALMLANLTAGVLIPFSVPFLGERMVSAGIISFPITFLLTDLLNEFYGQAGAKRVTMLGFGMAIGVAVIFKAIDQLPILETSPISAEAYAMVSSQFTGMLFASLTAYLIGQYLDIYLFRWFKAKTGDRLIWLRATGSTVVSQLIDSYLVMLIAFWGVMPLDQILLIGQSNYEVKLLVAIGITPLLYLGHALIKRMVKTDRPRENHLHTV